MRPVTDPAILKLLNGGLPSDKSEAQIAAEGAAKRSEGVNPDGSIPGYPGTLDRSKAGDNWSTIGTAENGLNLTRVVPGHGLIAKNPAEFLGQQFRRTGDSYGAFETDQAGAASMNGGGLSPVTDPAILAQLNGDAAPTFDTAADSAARGLPPNPAAEPVAHTGYRAQVNRTMSGNGPQSRPAPNPNDLATQWKDAIGGTLTGIPAGWLGTLGDVEGMARFLPSKVTSLSPEPGAPTSSRMGDIIAGPASSPEAAGGRTVGNMLSPFLLMKGLKLLTGAERVASTATEQAAAGAREGGYVIPPNMASENPSLTSQALSSFAGKTKTNQLASVKNAEQSAANAAEDIGLPKDHQITEASLEGVRADAGKAYEAAKRAPIQIIADDTFKGDIGNLDQVGAEVRAEVPELVSNPELEKLVATLSGKEQFSPAAAVDLARDLRYKAQVNLKNYAAPEKLALGRAQSRAANALETLIERNMEAATTARAPIGAQGGDMTALVENLRAARTRIAKSYNIEDALNPITGNVDANKLAAAQARGAPLTGNLKGAADAATAFGKAFQNPVRFGGNENSSVLDAAVLLHGGMTGKLGKMAEAAGWLVGRPLARKLILSNFYQNSAIPKLAPAPGAPGAGGTATASATRMFDPKLLALVGPQVAAQLLLQSQNAGP